MQYIQIYSNIIKYIIIMIYIQCIQYIQIYSVIFKYIKYIFKYSPNICNYFQYIQMYSIYSNISKYI